MADIVRRKNHPDSVAGPTERRNDHRKSMKATKWEKTGAEKRGRNDRRVEEQEENMGKGIGLPMILQCREFTGGKSRNFI